MLWFTDKRFASCMLLVVLLLSNTTPANSGMIGVGICYAGCASVTVACFAAAGAVFGVAKACTIDASPALKACNTAFSGCSKACVSAFSS